MGYLGLARIVTGQVIPPCIFSLHSRQGTLLKQQSDHTAALSVSHLSSPAVLLPLLLTTLPSAPPAPRIS